MPSTTLTQQRQLADLPDLLRLATSFRHNYARVPNLYGSRGLCRLVRLARGNSSDLVVTVVPESLIDENLLGVAGGGELHKPAGTFGGTRLKKCHWQDISKLWLRPIASTLSPKPLGVPPPRTE